MILIRKDQTKIGGRNNLVIMSEDEKVIDAIKGLALAVSTGAIETDLEFMNETIVSPW